MTKTFGIYLRTLVYCLAWLCAIVLMVIPAIVVACFPERYRYNSRVILFVERCFSALLLGTAGVKFSVIGREHIPANTPVIFAANHQSTLDILLLSQVVPRRPHVWVFWFGIAKFWLMSFVLRRTQVVVEASPRRAVQAIHDAVSLLSKYPMDLIIFPEGGRFVDGVVHKFLRGVGIISCQSHRPVVPIALINPGLANPPHSAWIYPYDIQVIVGQPVVCQAGESEEQFVERLRSWFVQQEPLIRE